MNAVRTAFHVQFGNRLITTSALASALAGNSGFLLIECDEDAGTYRSGHIPGARCVDWRTELRTESGSPIGPQEFRQLKSRLGIGPATEVVFYGDCANWWAAYALWVFHLHGHLRTRLLDGGRDKWLRERRAVTAVVPPPARAAATGPRPVSAPGGTSSLAGLFDVMGHLQRGHPLVDVRSPREFAGEITHPPEHPSEQALRAGHIPGAVSLPWSLAVTESGTFKSAEKLREIYQDVYCLDPNDEIIVYCRIGERSSHTWFVLAQLLGFRSVKNYAGSWMEWGNRMDTPVAAR